MADAGHRARRKDITMWRFRSFITCLFCVSLLIAGPASSRVGEDRAAELAAIESTLADYLEGGKTGDIERLARAFHPAARLQFVRRGAYGEWSIDEHLASRRPGKRSNHRTRVLSIDFAGNAAVAKLELDHGTFKYVDYMSLLKVEGRWWVVNKIFHRIPE